MDIIAEMRGFESDHEPDGWPAIQMKQVSALCDEIERLQGIIDKANAQEPVGYMVRGSFFYSKVEAEKSADHLTANYENTDVINVYATPIPAQQSPEPRGTNQYGLDVGYMTGKLNILIRDIDSYKCDEASRTLLRLAKVANESVLSEPEFAQPAKAAIPDGYCLAPNEPTESMLEAGVAMALQVSVHGEGGWSKYLRGLYKQMLSASPKPE